LNYGKLLYAAFYQESTLEVRPYISAPYGPKLLITCTAQNSDSGSNYLSVWSKAATQLIESKLTATGGTQAFGAITAQGGILTLDNCYIQGTFALYDSDGISPITANGCLVNGPISNSVTVNHEGMRAEG
jgi:hypothetical protein